jgi:integrase
MGAKLTEKFIEKLPTPKSGYKITYDEEVGGFGVRVTEAGARSFILRYRTKSGRERTYTIGPAGNGWKVSVARAHAKDLKARLRTEPGYDPLAEIEAERDAPTVARLFERFAEDWLPKKRLATRQQYQRSFEKYVLPELKHRKVAEVDYSDVDRLHRNVTKRAGPYQANRTVAALSKAMNLAAKWKWRETNPCKGIERNAEAKRRRYLDGNELVRLTDALNKHPDTQAANVIRMLLLTGARRGEVLGMRWADVDLGAGVWTKLGSTTKQKTDHVVPLSAPVRQLLVDIRATAERLATKKHRAISDFVFPARVGGGHRVDIKKDWAELCRAANIITTKKTAKGRAVVTHSARIHDLRHTHASVLASAGFSLPMIGALLGHAQASTTQRYSHLYLDAQRKAVETAASIIAPGGQGAEILKHPKATS